LIPVGQPIPDVELQSSTGEPTRLADYFSGPMLLIFLRHLA
jgi:peroxiredoxin